MHEILIGTIAGAVGGAIRTITTIAYSKMSEMKINIKNSIFYLITFTLTGALSGLVFGPGIVLSFVMGFVGIDILDTYYNAIMKKKIVMK